MSLLFLKLWVMGYIYPFILLFQMNAYIMYLEVFFKVFFNFYWNHFLCCNFLTLITNNHNNYDCNRIPYFVFNDTQLTFIGIFKLTFPFYDDYKNNPTELNLILNEWI